MRNLFLTLGAAALASLLAGQVAYAQPSGLKLEGGAKGIVLRDTESGLRLRFSTRTNLPDSWWNTTSSSSRNTLSADWPLDLGVHTSLGLSWDVAQTGASGQASSTPSTFVGLGWNSSPSRSTRWALSAEVGTHLTGNNACKGSQVSCANPQQPAGLTGNAMGSGLRLAPYVSFGATYSFDR